MEQGESDHSLALLTPRVTIFNALLRAPLLLTVDVKPVETSSDKPKGTAVSSRDEILRGVRQGSPAATDPPPPFMDSIEFADPISQFSEVLSGVGGKCAPATSNDELRQIVASIAGEVGAVTICSWVDGIDSANVDPGGFLDPHDAENVDLSIMPGHLAVAENAAVWVTATSPVERTLYFLSQHLVLVVPRDHVISNLHQAYERIDVTATTFGTWISGPSKTADIEQSLVKGAHGPRTLTVVLFGAA